VREAARALNKELEEKNKQLKDQEAVVERLAVSLYPSPCCLFGKSVCPLPLVWDIRLPLLMSLPPPPPPAS